MQNSRGEKMNDDDGCLTAESIEERAKWGGQPPAGGRPVVNRNLFILKVIGTLAIAIGIWTIYRAVGGHFFEGLHSRPSMLSDIFAKPILTVLPVWLCWRFFFKEKRAPVRFERKNMASGILSALVLVSTFIFFLYFSELFFFRLFGVRTPGFSLVAGWLVMDPWEFILIWFMFVASTGFAEEFEARGFLQDQLGRAMPIWASVTITGFIFAAGHIPIFIFIHNLSFWQGFYYFVYLIPMSFFLSLYYHWSRNLPAVMIYHGLFDWMLSAIYVTAEYQQSYFNSVHVQWGIFFLASLFAIGANLVLLYIFYRIFWKRDRPAGSLGFKMPGISNWRMPRRVRLRMDRDSLSWSSTILALVVASMVFSGLVMGFGAAFGDTDPNVASNRMVGMTESKELDLTQYDLLESQMTSISDHATEGEAMTLVYTAAEENVANVTFRMTWIDEEDTGWIGSAPNHENQPDTFTIVVESPDGNISASETGANQHGQEGVIEFTVGVPVEKIPSVNGTGKWSITITVEAGDNMPKIIGAFRFDDYGNDFTLEISYEYYIKSGVR